MASPKASGPVSSVLSKKDKSVLSRTRAYAEPNTINPYPARLCIFS